MSKEKGYPKIAAIRGGYGTLGDASKVRLRTANSGLFGDLNTMNLPAAPIPPVYIPTRGRAERQVTWDFLAGTTVRETTTLICPADEVKTHTQKGRRAVSCPAQGKGLSAVLQWIQETYGDNGPIITMDDDLRILTWKSEFDAHQRNATKEEVNFCFGQVAQLLTLYPSVGLAPRLYGGLNRELRVQMDANPGLLGTYPFQIASRQFNVHATQPDVLRRLGLRYDAIPLMQDFHMTLSLLEAGYANAILLRFMHSEDPAGLKGGCQIYRTMDMQRAAARRLWELHPDHVNPKAVVSKVGWGRGEFRERVDVTVQWQKAFQRGQTQRTSSLF